MGIDNSSNKLRFTTEDATNPTLSTSSPTDGATNVNTLSSLVLTFDEDIDAETGGEVYLYKSDDTLVKTYSVTDTDYVTRSSSSTYTVDISAELDVLLLPITLKLMRVRLMTQLAIRTLA